MLINDIRVYIDLNCTIIISPFTKVIENNRLLKLKVKSALILLERVII